MKRDVLSDLPLFLAHSLELEQESAERLREFADTMRHHQQAELAALFDELAAFSDLHTQEIAAVCEGIELPRLKPWEFKWPDNEAPETSAYADLHYEMQPEEALRLMAAQEGAAADFYADVAARSPDPEIVKHAAEFAKEERQHAALLHERLAALQASARDAAQPAPDIDPPHQPE
jgi:rubrerythrin